MPNSIDLGFYKPDNWYDKAVIMPDAESSFTTEKTLYDHEFLYLSFAPTNYGDADSAPFFVDVYFDGEYCRRVPMDALQSGFYETCEDMSVGSFTVGTHTVTLLVDSALEEDSDPSNNIYSTTFTVAQNPDKDFYDGYYGGDSYSLDCKVTLSLQYGKYVLSGNFIGSETGKRVNALMVIYDSRGKKMGTVSVKKGKVAYKEFTLAKDKYTVYVLSTDNQKTADRITFNVSGEVFYKFNLNDNCIEDVAGRDPYVVYVQDVPRTLIADGWVGFGDVLSCREIDFLNSGRYTFTVNTSDKLKLTLVQVTIDGKGRPKEKKITSTSVSGKKIGRNISFGDVLIEKGEYYLVAEALSAAKGTNADFSVSISSESTFYVDADDGENNWIYDKNIGPNDPDNIYRTTITGETTEIFFDWYDVEPEDYDNFVGFSDAVDYARISLSGRASLSFLVEASDSVKFSVVALIPKKGGKYSEKELQKVTIKKGKKDEYVSAATGAIELEEGEYFLRIQSTTASKGGEAFYNVFLNADGCSGLENLSDHEKSALDAADELSSVRAVAEDLPAAGFASGVAEQSGDPAWRDLVSLA